MILALRCPKCRKYDNWKEVSGYAYCECGAAYVMDDLDLPDLAKLVICYPLAEITERAPLMLDPDEFSDYDGEDDE
jgi:hypothetical protein